MSDIIVKNKKPNIEKRTLFGFVKSNDVYTYLTTIVNNQFQMAVNVSKDE